MVKIDLHSSKKGVELRSLIGLLEHRELFFERYSLQESDTFYSRFVRQ